MFKMSRRALSKQKSNIAQTFSANCNISCHKVIDGKTIKFKDGKKFRIDKQCTVKGACLMDATIGALSNLEFAASHSSNTKDARKGKIGLPGEDNPAIARSRQELNTTITQTAVDRCNTDAADKISDVVFLTTRRTFAGPMALVQAETTKPSCVLSRALDASALATITSNNASTRGKDQKRSMNTALWIAVAAVVSGSVISAIAISASLNPPPP